MSLAWSTIALLVTLLPGFAFLAGLTMPERFNRETPPINTLGQLAVVVASAFFLHGLLLSTAFGCSGHSWCIRLDVVFAAFHLSEAAQIKPTAVAANITSNAPQIVAYFALTSGLGALFGFWVGQGRVNSRWPFRWLTRHSWIYQLNPDPNGMRVAMGYVVTDIEPTKRRLIYQGHLIDFGVAQDGTFTYLVLQSPTRRYLTFEDTKAVLGPPLPLSSREQVGTHGVSLTSDGFMVIEGERVQNFFFRPYAANLAKGAAEATDTLYREGPAPASLIEAPEMLQPSDTRAETASSTRHRATRYPLDRWLRPLLEWGRLFVAALLVQAVIQTVWHAAGLDWPHAFERTGGVGAFFLIFAYVAIRQRSAMKWWMAALTAVAIALGAVLVYVVASFI